MPKVEDMTTNELLISWLKAVAENQKKILELLDQISYQTKSIRNDVFKIEGYDSAMVEQGTAIIRCLDHVRTNTIGCGANIRRIDQKVDKALGNE